MRRVSVISHSHPPVRRPAVQLLAVILLLLAGACSQQEGDGGRFQALTDYFSSQIAFLGLGAIAAVALAAAIILMPETRSSGDRMISPAA